MADQITVTNIFLLRRKKDWIL